MLTVEQLNDLKVGDLVEGGPMLKGLTDEPLIMKLVELKDDTRAFVTTYFGVTIGRLEATPKDGKIEWRFL